MNAIICTRAALAAALLLAACAAPPAAPPAPVITPEPTHAVMAAGQPDADRCAIVRRAVAFLAGQYDPAFHLLRESPVTAPDKHWLATDNALALAALRGAAPCAPESAPLAASIAQGIAAYGAAPHGLIETVSGGVVEWPPRTPTQTEAAPGLWREERLTGDVMEDWREYADLALIGVMHLAQSGQLEAARALYAETLPLFDGMGFADKAHRSGGAYASYKLALAILAAAALGEPPAAAVIAQLLDQQDAAGGFFALYDAGGALNDANTETTAYSILALMALAPKTPPLPVDVQPAIDGGLAFLRAQYNPDLGLMQESPDIGRNHYFLANDAILAERVFALYGEQELAVSLRRTLDRYGVAGNGLIEVAWGEPVAWPPLHFEDPGTLVASAGDAQILTIRHDGPGYFYDWSAYSNLAFMAAVNEWNGGYEESARRLYDLEAGTFDGRGFPDRAYWDRNGVYETLGLAWGVYAAGLLCIRPDAGMLRSLLLRQDAGGGFHTHYSAAADRLADPNVETSAVALLALNAIRQTECRPPARPGVPAP